MKTKHFIIFAWSVFIISCNGPAESSLTKAEEDTVVFLKNETSSVRFSLLGGAIIDFHLLNDTVNPFTWKLSPADMPANNKKGAPFQGHFLCLGRWGGPTPGEIKEGIPHNGEASNNWWELKRQTTDSLLMNFEAKLEGIFIERQISMAPKDALFKITEEFTNILSVARNIPIVQHATIGIPFLDTSVVVFSNASKGFNQKFVPGHFEKHQTEWPFIKVDSTGKITDVRKSMRTEDFVATYIFEDSIGWIAAYNPGLKQIVGYVWKTKEYPWLHLWHGIKDGKLWAKGLEFGTTGLGDTSPMEERFLLNFHGTSNLNYIDANTSIKKSYYCFLVKFDEQLKEISNISITETGINIFYPSEFGELKKNLQLR